MPNILITPVRNTLTGVPSVAFQGCSGSGISLNVNPTGPVQFVGNAGGLLLINDTLSGSLLQVNDSAGVTLFNIGDDGTMIVGEFNTNKLIVTGSNVGMGTGRPATNLHVTGVGRFDAGVVGAGFYIYSTLTGDYTVRSGAASVAQLYGLSGQLVNGSPQQSFTAKNYLAAVSGAAYPIILGDPTTVTGTYNIDLTNSPALQTISITGATLFSGVNYVAGSAATVRVNMSGASAVPVRFPNAWNWVSATPTGLAPSRFAILTLNTFTAADTGVCVAWAVGP